MGLPVRTAEKRPGVVLGVNGAAYMAVPWSVWVVGIVQTDLQQSGVTKTVEAVHYF